MKQLKSFPFPSSPVDGQLAVDGDITCEYFEDSNTWKCQRTTIFIPKSNEANQETK
jgi:hypothetical protein